MLSDSTNESEYDGNQIDLEVLVFHSVPKSLKTLFNIFQTSCTFRSFYPIETLLFVGVHEEHVPLIDMCLAQPGSFNVDTQLNDGIISQMKDDLVQNYRFDQDTGTALWFACYYGHLNIVRALIEHGHADVDLPNCKYQSPLHAAIAQQHMDIVRYLVEQAHANIDDIRHLMVALKTENCDMVDYLLNQGCDPNTRLLDEPVDRTYFALHYAISQISSNISIVQTLLDKGANPTIQDERNQTALHVAVQCRDEQKVKEILRREFHHRQRDNNGDTPLMLAMTLESRNVIDVFYRLYPRQDYIDELMLAACKWAFHERFAFFEDTSIAYIFFEQALRLQEPNVSAIPACDIYLFRTECQTIDELMLIRDVPDLMYIQAFLVCERLLPQRDEIHLLIPELFRLYDIYHQATEYDRCLLLLMHMFPLILSSRENSFRFWRTDCLALFVELLGTLIVEDNIRLIDEIVKAFGFIFRITDRLSELVYSCLYVAYAIENDQFSLKNKHQLLQYVKEAVHRKFEIGCRDLFESVSRQCVFRSDDPFFRRIIPVNVIRMLIHCGADVNILVFGDDTSYRRNSSLLHLIAHSGDIDLVQPIVELLVAAGIHTDRLDTHGHLPEQCATNTEIRELLHSKRSLLLKCQCAHLILAEQISYESYLSNSLKSFVRMHRIQN
ncbi:unnamed protein product [Adineta ricciae]|uniref:Uncharacterized protein n=2 Tax=Adineta ricciae TaxID=249248 RepID=A0A815HDS4_ADIRI|nr:unnamed protein product [Adineta ricciae]